MAARALTICGVEWHYLHQPQWLAVARRTKGVWASQGPPQLLEALDNGVFARIMAGLAAERAATRSAIASRSCSGG
jgi:hypothetical protein